MYYYLTTTRRTLTMSIENEDIYFNSERAMNAYKERFNKFLYEEDEYFISASGKAEFNANGVLVKKK